MIIALSGRMGAGKSKAVDLLKEQGLTVCLSKFASPLYAIQEAAYRIISPVYQRPADFVKDRTFLQWVGTSWGRGTISENLWVDLWKNRTEFIRSKDSDVVIVCDDCRFDNEAEAVHSLGGFVIKIERPDSTAHAGGGEGIVGHASEAGLDPSLVDFTIVNSGTVEEFKESLSKVLEQIKAELAA